MDQDVKNLIAENSLKRIQKVFDTSDEPIDKLCETIMNISVKSAIIVLEEYEKLNKSL